MVYVAIDGDDIGRLLTQEIYKSNNTETALINFSKSVTKTFENLANWIIKNKGEVLLCAGDSILFKIEEDLVDLALSNLTQKHFTVSVGVGENLKEAHWALNVAKSLGKSRVVNFNQVKNDIFGYQ